MAGSYLDFLEDISVIWHAIETHGISTVNMDVNVCQKALLYHFLMSHCFPHDNELHSMPHCPDCMACHCVSMDFNSEQDLAVAGFDIILAANDQSMLISHLVMITGDLDISRLDDLPKATFCHSVREAITIVKDSVCGNGSAPTSFTSVDAMFKILKECQNLDLLLLLTSGYHLGPIENI